MNRADFESACATFGLVLTGAQLDAFELFEESLYRANEVMNLTRIPREDCWIRHFLDSLLHQSLMPMGASVLDIGTGPGFPAWPLAQARPDLQLTALDSNGKMLGFLRNHPLSNLTVVQERAEEWRVRERFDVVTGRAVAPLPIQLELSAAAARKGGLVIPMRTAREEMVQAEVLGLSLSEVIERVLPHTDAVRVFPVYVKTGTTPPAYPRRWPEIKSKPLS